MKHEGIIEIRMEKWRKNDDDDWNKASTKNSKIWQKWEVPNRSVYGAGCKHRCPSQ